MPKPKADTPARLAPPPHFGAILRAVVDRARAGTNDTDADIARTAAKNPSALSRALLSRGAGDVLADVLSVRGWHVEIRDANGERIA